MAEAKKINLPKVNLSGFSLEELTAALESENNKGGGKFLQPGQHEVKIVSAEYKGQASGDSTWCKHKITFEGAGGKTANTVILSPTTSFAYGPKKTTFLTLQLKAFLTALGFTFNAETAGEIIEDCFHKTPSKLNGLNVKITIGYRKPYLKYTKNERDEVEFVLTDPATNSPVKTASGQEFRFADRESAKMELDAEIKAGKVDVYSSILSYEPSVTPNSLDETDAAW